MSDSQNSMGYRLISGTKLKIVSSAIIVDNPFLVSSIQYVTRIYNTDTMEPLTPIFSKLVYDEEKQLFIIEDQLALPFQLVHISLSLNLNLEVVGNAIFNDYFDDIDFISGIGNSENNFASYEYYKYAIYCKIFEDKERRNNDHQKFFDRLVLKYQKDLDKGV